MRNIAKEMCFFLVCLVAVGAFLAVAIVTTPQMQLQNSIPPNLSPKKQAALQQAKASVSLEAYCKIDLNTATKEQLCLLSGIGEEKASLILEYRAFHGAFDTIEDITAISGITMQMIEDWGDQVCLTEVTK